MKSVFFLSLMNGGAWGGSEEAWFRTALWMCKNNFKVGIACFHWKEKEDRLNKLKEAGCNIYLFPNKKGLFKKWAVKKELAGIPFADYDLTVVNQGGWEDILHAPFKNLYRKLDNYVVFNHNYNEEADLSSGKQALLRRWLESASMNFAATGKIFEVIERKFGISIDKKATLINPITFDPGTKPVAYPPLTNNNYTWVMLAELDIARKAQDILIRALASVKWKERNWELHLYGKGKGKQMLEELVKELELDGKVFLKGFSTDIKHILAQGHLLLQCTRIDAMPLSVVEAMAMARPCVVSSVGDMPVWVEDGKNGFVCGQVTSDGIEQTLEKCWKQKDHWAEMGVRSFEIFSKKFPQPYEERMAGILGGYCNNKM